MMAPDPSIGPYGLVAGPCSAFLPLADHEAKFLEAQRRPLANCLAPKSKFTSAHRAFTGLKPAFPWGLKLKRKKLRVTEQAGPSFCSGSIFFISLTLQISQRLSTPVAFYTVI